MEQLTKLAPKFAEITNVEQLGGALSYIFQSYFGHDYSAKIESGTLNLEVGDHRIAKRSQNFMEKGSVIHIRVWYSTLTDPMAPQLLDLLGYSLEQLNTKLFGMQDSLLVYSTEPMETSA